MTLVIEVLLGGAVGALIQAIFVAKERATFFRTTLEHLQSTLQSVVPVMEQVIMLGQAHNDVFIEFIQQLEKAKILVEMYSDTRKWKLLKQRKVKKLIQKMDASLQRFLAQDFQVQQLLFLAIIGRDVVELNRKMDRTTALIEGEKDSSFPEPAEEGGNEDSELPEPKAKEILFTSEENLRSDKRYNYNAPAFEFHWEMRKDKSLDIRFWRRSHE